MTVMDRWGVVEDAVSRGLQGVASPGWGGGRAEEHHRSGHFEDSEPRKDTLGRKAALPTAWSFPRAGPGHSWEEQPPPG